MVHVAIIGAYGSAGVAVADELLDLGDDVRLTLLDDGEPGGGLCILRGCMPSKEVLSAGAHRFQARHDHRLDGTPEVDLGTVVETKDEHVRTFAQHRRAAVHEMADRENVEFLHETARFTDDRTVRAGERVIEPDYVVLATGSTVNVPDLPGMDEIEYASSADVLDGTEFPETGVVMGFGYVGLELVPYLSEAAGMDLTVVEHDARPVDEADPVFGDRVLELYREKFDVEVLTHTAEQSIEPTTDGGVRLHVDRVDRVDSDDGDNHDDRDGRGDRDDRDHRDARDETVEADQLFLFTGRRPSLDGLELNRTALEPGQGWVDDTMQAVDDERVFVVGDANGHEPILHVAKEQGHVAAANILRHDRGEGLAAYENVHHHVIFSGLGVYPFVRVGHSEASAAAADLDHIAVTREASDDGVFATKDVPEGLARLVVGTDGTVLGYQGLHYHADVMAKTMQVAIEMGLHVRELPDRAYHPTTPEILDGLFRDASSALD